MINLGELGPAILRGIFKPQEAGVDRLFTKGEIVQGRVVRSLGKEGALVRLRGMNMLAATQKTLATGQSILVKVEQVKPNFVVSLLLNDTPVQEKTAALLRLYLPSAMPVGSVISELEMLLASLKPAALKGSGLESIMAELKNAIMKYTGEGKNVLEMLGLFHEWELSRKKPSQNLKRSLLAVRRNLEKLMEKDPALYRKALTKVTRALHNIELRQLLNLVDRQEVKSWQLPYWDGGAIASARLYISSESSGKRKNREADEPTRLWLMLEMSRIGPLRLDISASRKSLKGIFYLLTDDVVTEVKGHLPELVESLTAAGYQASFSVVKATRKFLTEELSQSRSIPATRLLNVKA